MRVLSLALALLVLTGAASHGSAQPAPRAAWVEMTATGPQIRAVAADSRCPIVSLDGVSTPMSVRAGPRAGFEPAVCQLEVPSGVRQAAIEARNLPLPAAAPKRILIFGDTGCRVKSGEAQNCNNPRAWPFALVARLAAAQKPDLVIHVGDYYYREDPCPDARLGCAGSPYGDRWETWRAEFFDPAAPLLSAAPWVFVRGNHESCARGGAGWFRLLDAGVRPLLCPSSSAPFRVDLGDLNLYVLDSADAPDRLPSGEAVAAFARQLDRLQPDLARHPGWILTHRPFWGLAPVARLGAIGPLEIGINRTEQLAVAGRDLSGVRMVVSGHIHHFSAISFGTARPAQLIAGTGGDEGEASDTSRLRSGTRDIDGLDSQRLTFERFGYLLLDRAGADWVGAFRDLDDHVIARCRLRGRDLTCAPADTPAS